MVIYIDVDETVCMTAGKKDCARDYSLAVPIRKNIAKANKLYNNGHTIVYWTARGGHSGLNWKQFTEYQLTNWKCKYTRIEKQKKPSYDLFICDKTKRIEEI